MRKTALHGLIGLFTVLLVCFFFSGTIRTLTTAKVMIASPKQGKLKEQIELVGYLYFSETDSIQMNNVPEGIILPVKKINVTKGSRVYAGDVLLEVDISSADGYITQQETIYHTAQEKLLLLDRQYANLRLTRSDRDWLNAYDGLLTAQAMSCQAHLKLDVLAQISRVVLNDGRLPEDVERIELLSAQAAADQADHELAIAQSTMDRASRSGISEDAYQYTMQRRTLESEQALAYSSLVDLNLLHENGGKLVANHDGYVVDVIAKEGDQWDGTSTAIILSFEEPSCYLRAYLPEHTRSITVGTQVTLTGLDSSQIRTRVAFVGFDSYGNSIIDIEFNANDISVLGTAYGLLNNGVQLTVNYVASANTVLIPTSAVRGYGNERYVYTIAEERNAFGQSIYIVEKKTVNVLDDTNEYASIASSSNLGRIAYMEDRNISEGSEVIPYE